MENLLNWLDDRTGYRSLVKNALYERIPGGARWRYVWGSTLMFAMFVQFVTGLVLWAAYSANAQGAWESVHYIQNVMLGGWMLRGIHHYMAQVTIVLLVLHLMQVLIDGAYRAPREVNFWFGLGLLGLVLGLSLTGYLLPWDQKGYWATKVATSIASMTPVVGPAMQQLLVGGAEYGHHTLTRFFACRGRPADRWTCVPVPPARYHRAQESRREAGRVVLAGAGPQRLSRIADRDGDGSSSGALERRS